MSNTLVFPVVSFVSSICICRTCNKALKKDHLTCQAVANKLNMIDVQIQFKSINKLVRVLVVKRILFKKSKFSKINGSTCNIRIDGYLLK